MGVRAFVPVQEAFHIDDVADLQAFNGLVGIGVLAGKIELNAEVEYFAVSIGEADIDVVRLLGRVLVVDGFAVILCRNRQALEQDLFVLLKTKQKHL